MCSQGDIIKLLQESFDVVVRQSQPATALPSYIPPAHKAGKTYVIGAGKASAEMARVFEERYEGDIAQGLIVTRYGFEVPTKRIEVLQAAHPVPDEAGVDAVERIFHLLSKVEEGDLVVCLLSGGGSALLSAPVEGLSFDALQAVTKELLLSGADIAQMNIVRKHLNRALGGGLAGALKAGHMITLAISDVAHNDPSVIASGPTVGDESTLEMCREILRRYEIDIPSEVARALDALENETPCTDDPVFDRCRYHLIATPDQALDAAAGFWREKGYMAHIIDAHLGGDTNKQAIAHVENVLGKAPVGKPLAVLSGGETTVKVTGGGLGGPNTQFMLQSLLSLDSSPQIYAMACDTDGIDGAGDNAGAYITPNSLSNAKGLGLDASLFLDKNDSYNFFKPLGNLVITGATQTNVNDYRVFLVFPNKAHG